MSVWQQGYDTTISVKPQSGEGSEDDPTYGSAVEVECKKETELVRTITANGAIAETQTRFITAEREFKKSDAIFDEGVSTTDIKNADFPSEVGFDSMAGETLYWAVL